MFAGLVTIAVSIGVPRSEPGRGAESFRQTVERDDDTGRQDQQPLHHIFQLANVARPVVALERLDHPWSEPLRYGRISGVLLEKVINEQRQIVPTRSKRRDLDRHHIQTVIKIGAEFALLHQGLDVGIRRRHDPDIDLAGHVLSDPPHFVLLQDPQKTCLERGARVGDLVEKDRAAARLLDEADTVPVRPGERAAHAAEQLGLEQVFRQRAAVDGHELLLLTRAGVVDRLRHELLAGAALPDDEYVAVAVEHPADGLTELLHHRRRTNQMFEAAAPGDVPLESGVLRAHVAEQPRVLDSDRRLARERLHECPLLVREQLRGLARVEIDNADRPAVRPHRDAQNRLDLVDHETLERRQRRV